MECAPYRSALKSHQHNDYTPSPPRPDLRPMPSTYCRAQPTFKALRRRRTLPPRLDLRPTPSTHRRAYPTLQDPAQPTSRSPSNAVNSPLHIYSDAANSQNLICLIICAVTALQPNLGFTDSYLVYLHGYVICVFAGDHFIAQILFPRKDGLRCC